MPLLDLVGDWKVFARSAAQLAQPTGWGKAKKDSGDCLNPYVFGAPGRIRTHGRRLRRRFERPCEAGIAACSRRDYSGLIDRQPL